MSQKPKAVNKCEILLLKKMKILKGIQGLWARMRNKKDEEATKESMKEGKTTKKKNLAKMDKVVELDFWFYKERKNKKPKKVDHIRYHFYKEREANKEQDKEKEANKEKDKEKEATKEQGKEKEATKDQNKEKEATREILDQFETPWANFLVQKVNSKWMEQNQDAFKEMELLDEFEIRGTTFLVMWKKGQDDEKQ